MKLDKNVIKGNFYNPFWLRIHFWIKTINLEIARVYLTYSQLTVLWFFMMINFFYFSWESKLWKKNNKLKPSDLETIFLAEMVKKTLANNDHISPFPGVNVPSIGKAFFQDWKSFINWENIYPWIKGFQFYLGISIASVCNCVT